MRLFPSFSQAAWMFCMLFAGVCCLPVMLLAQAVPPKPLVPTVESGLEQAVKWSWQVEPSDAAAWGIPVDVPVEAVAVPMVKPSNETPAPKGSEAKPAPKVVPKGPPTEMIEHAVVKGESLTVIARANGVTVDQLRIFNALNNDRIVIGQVVKVPSEKDIEAMIAAATPTKENTAREAPAAKPKKTPAPVPDVAPVLIATKLHRALPPAAWAASALVLIQAFLDRQGFTIGPIDGTSGPMYDAAYKAFEKAQPGQLHTDEGQPSPAMKAIGGPYVEYVLTAADMRWIAPLSNGVGSKAKNKAVEVPPTFEELTQATFLPYHSGWEFVAERFHATESFLRNINPGIKNARVPGAVFLVPNVQPFEIEKALAAPLQPAADPAAPISASVVGFNRLVIRRGDAVIASMPVSAARPGLRGRKTWKILEVIPRPRLTSAGDATAPLPAPVSLAPGPNNPAGILWLNLAKSGDPKVLPYGLHGTSIPGLMTRQESVGGFRLTNWDIARAVRLLPVGTELKWE